MRKILSVLLFCGFVLGASQKLETKKIYYDFNHTSKDNFVAKIEFGKNLLLDCNNYFLGGGKITKIKNDKEIYRFSDKNAVLGGTRMLCDEPKTKKFVFFSKNLLLNNPDKIIFIVPKDVDVKITIFNETSNKFIK